MIEFLVRYVAPIMMGVLFGVVIILLERQLDG